MRRGQRDRQPLVCSIGSTDPTAAAGIGRDLVVYERLGARGVFAVAAVTAQNRRRVLQVRPVSAGALAAQLEAIWQERKPDAIRIGLLPNRMLMRAVERFLRSLRSRPPVVLDPVMRASSGRRFVRPADVGALKRLLPLVTLVTPNAAEAEALTGVHVRNAADAQRAAISLRTYGCAALIKGSHLTGARVVDVLADRHGVRSFAAPRIRTTVRGTGCTLAAAIAVALAHGIDLRSAIARGRAFVRRELKGRIPRLKRRGLHILKRWRPKRRGLQLRAKGRA